ncbi:MAG TPA: citrate synthase family protein [Anaerolineae bacterium]
MTKQHYLTAKEAAAELGVTVPTLYAYVSRGLIRSEATEGKKRTRRYRRADIDALKARRDWRRHPARAAETALHFGAPVLESAITLIADGRLYYRGHDVLKLSEQCSFEQVAALIWTGDFDAHPLFHEAGHLPAGDLERYRAIEPRLETLRPVEAFQVVLPLAAARDLAAYDFSPAAVAQTGARILRLLALIATGQEPVGAIARSLQRAWVADDASVANLFNAAFILCADHELNVSSFTARCVASAGSTAYAAVTAGLAALQGSKHGGYTERVEALFAEASSPEGVRPTIASRLKRGEPIPGFGHRLYPEGDPRGQRLLELVAVAYPKAAAVTLARKMAAEVESAVGFRPTIDFGLVTLARALNLPPGTALALFALGRTAGWIGHAIEQYQSDQIIRPRARYVGHLPETES